VLRASLIAIALGLSLAACAPRRPPPAASIGDAARGGQLINIYGCGSCHQIPGVAGAYGLSGPPLDHMAARTIIAGYLPNTPPNMERWLMSPQSVAPGNAMPNLGLNPRDAQDMTAYLESLR
jgi:cytochrome c2